MTLERKPQSQDPQSQHTPTQILRIYVENDKADLNITYMARDTQNGQHKDQGYSTAGSVLDYREARGSFPRSTQNNNNKRHTDTHP